MTDAAQSSPSHRRIEILDALPPGTARDILALLEEAAEHDGQWAVSEQGRLNLRGGERPGVRHLLVYLGDELAGYAQIEDTDPVEPPAAELLIRPAHRTHGHGRALGRALLDATGKRLRVWAHGGHPSARHLAVQLGLNLFRELRQLRRPLDDGPALPEPVIPAGISVRTFVPGQDDAAWLAVNAAAFAHHPEQGALTQRDLDDRKAEPWFDPEGFFLAVRGEKVVGFHWTKVHRQDRLGEVYVVGVHPDEQDSGLGKALTAIGLRHLADDEKLPTAMLYVDADNIPAVTVYERLGFTTHEVDLMYRTDS
ncbi:mycothiol synthase [Streptomyces sp. H10-C2]|uniref:mycothiol synthase n=1 Tax=unclassified Streptomyces TaxID=2593676 RepID=UPI0024B8F15F|nr:MULTISPECIES: mycothiol synthase [unclassified Streptomyces]MDJ0345099.1 mycothiol synthase [Streptomyces sp. PH10-H1]MDJ0374004.1 mycothiol synthase [Streptomyces sp. H10-C2]